MDKERKRKERELEEAAGYGGVAPASAARKSQKAGEEGEAQDTKYRDRAAERRQGVSLDYVDVVEPAKELTEEQTKYLGGDIQHTHLVKGLDMSLLLKARDDERAAAMRDGAKEGGKQASLPLANVNVSCEVGRRVKFAMELGEQQRQVVAGGSCVQQDMFLPRRTTYVFDMMAGSPDDAYAVLPILVTRSKDDCPELPPSIRPSLPPSTVSAIAQVVRNVSNGVYAQRAVDRAAAARAARIAAASSSPSADSTPHHTPLPLPPVDMFSDAPLPAFVGPARGGGGAASACDDAPAAAAASPTGAAAAAMPPPRPVSKQKDTKFIGFGGISAAYDDVYDYDRAGWSELQPKEQGAAAGSADDRHVASMFQAVKVDPKEGVAAAIARKKEQERLMKEKEDKKQAGRGGAAKFRVPGAQTPMAKTPMR